MVVPLTVDGWPFAPILTTRLVLRAPEVRDREAFLDLGTDGEVNRHLGGVPADRPGQFVVEHDGELVGWIGFTELARFEEYGAEQWFGVRHPGVRRAGAADATRMAEVAEAAYTPYLERMAGMRPGPLDADYAAAVAESEAWVVERDGDLVAFLLLVAEDDALLLDNVAVLPSHHGQGVGRALLTLAEGRAVALGHDRIRLFTHVTMVENQRLYERLGYVETHRAGEHGLVRVFYEKSLGGESSRKDQGI